MHKRRIVLGIVLLFAVFAGSFAVLANSSEDFTDLPRDHRVGPAVYSLVDQDIITGFPDQSFRFGDHIKRGDAAVMIARALEYEDLEKEDVFFNDPFHDVLKGDRYFNATNWLKEENITSGYTDGSFQPRESISRAEMAVILARAFNLEKTSDTYSFDDRGTSTQDFVQALYDHGITKGMGNNRFGSDDPITRGDFSVFLYEILESGHATEDFRVVDIY